MQWTNLLIGGGLRVGRPAMLRALRATLERLGVERLDLWQIHFPFPSYPQSTLAEGLQEAYEAGLVSLNVRRPPCIKLNKGSLRGSAPNLCGRHAVEMQRGCWKTGYTTPAVESQRCTQHIRAM